QPECSAVHLRRGDQLVPVLQYAQQRIRDRRHSRRCHHCRLCPLQRRNLPFRHRQRRISVPRVDVRLALSLCPPLHLFAGRKRKRRRTHNLRRHRDAHAVPQRFSRVNCFRLRVALLLVVFHDQEYSSLHTPRQPPICHSSPSRSRVAA